MKPTPEQNAERAALLAELEGTPAPTQKQARLRNTMLLISAVLVPFVLWLEAGGVREHPRPTWFVVSTAVGWLLAAAWALWASLARPRASSMLGRRKRWLHAVVIATPSAMFLWMLAWDLLDAEHMMGWPDRVGWRCMGLTLLLGAWPVVALVLMRRGSEPVHPGATGAAIGAAVGCASGLLLDLWCPITSPGHVLLGHILPLLALSFAGLLLGRALLAVRRSRP